MTRVFLVRSQHSTGGPRWPRPSSEPRSAFSAVKRLFGGAVRAKLPVAQKNEVLLKCLVFNLTCLVHAMYEFGLEPTFNAPMVLQ
jgi:hypothetical protein